jgi:hypothetical protein
MKCPCQAPTQYISSLDFNEHAVDFTIRIRFSHQIMEILLSESTSSQSILIPTNQVHQAPEILRDPLRLETGKKGWGTDE